MKRRAPIADTELPHSDGSIPRWIEVLENLAASTRGVRHGLAKTLAGRDVGESQFSVLWSCRQAAPVGISQSELAERLAISAAHISGLVEQMRRAGWLEGQRDPHDRRRQVWRATPAGQVLCDQLLDDIAAWLALHNAALAEIDHDQLSALAMRLGAALAEDAACSSGSGTSNVALLGKTAVAPPPGFESASGAPDERRSRKRGAA